METIEIKSIASSSNGTVFGLGADMKVYHWNTAKQIWELHTAGY